MILCVYVYRQKLYSKWNKFIYYFSIIFFALSDVLIFENIDGSYMISSLNRVDVYGYVNTASNI